MLKPTQLYTICGSCLLLAGVAWGQDRPAEGYRRSEVSTHMTNWTAGVNLASANIHGIDDNALSFGVFGDYLLSPNFSVGLSLDYWNDVIDTSPSRRVGIDDLVLGANSRFTFQEIAPGLRPFGLVGLAVHRFKMDVVQRDPQSLGLVDKFSEYDRKTKDIQGEFGADFAAGLLYRVQRTLDVSAEARYRRILDRAMDLDQMNYSVSLSYGI